MSTDVYCYDSSTNQYAATRYAFSVDLTDITYFRRILYGVDGPAGVMYSAMQLGIAGTAEKGSFGLQLPAGGGSVTGLTHDRRYLIGTIVDSLNPDNFVKWDFNGNLIAEYPNSFSKVGWYAQICFVNGNLYALATSSAPNEVHVYSLKNSSATLLKTFPLISNVYTGITTDRKNLLLLNRDKGNSELWSTTGVQLSGKTNTGKEENGATIDRRYKLIGITA